MRAKSLRDCQAGEHCSRLLCWEVALLTPREQMLHPGCELASVVGIELPSQLPSLMRTKGDTCLDVPGKQKQVADSNACSSHSGA